MPDFRIRRAKGDEAESLTSLAFRSKASWGYSLEFMAACKNELTFSAAEIESTKTSFYVCEIGAQVVGFYGLLHDDPDGAELLALFVHPDHIGEGIGKALVRHCRLIAIQLGVTEIVIQGDPNAEAFYLACGASARGYRESESIPGRHLPVFTISIQ